MKGAAAARAATVKHIRYPPHSKAPLLCAFAVETFGAWAPEAARLFGQAAHRAGELTGGSKERRRRFSNGWATCWRTRIHCALQQANAEILHCASHPHMPGTRPDVGPYGLADWEIACGSGFLVTE